MPLSFAAVYETHFDFVWSLVRRFGVSEHAVDDVVQEVFVIIHARLHTLRKRDSLRSWVYGVVRRKVSGYRRSRKAKLLSALEPDPANATLPVYHLTPLEQTERKEQLQRLAELLNELDDAKREIFLLAELEGMTGTEIAEALEIPVNTAYSRLRGARRAFELLLASAHRRAGSARDVACG